MQLKKRNDEIDEKLIHLLQAHEKGELDKLELAVKCCHTVKTSLAKKYIISIVLLLLVVIFLVTQICNFFNIQKKK